MTYLKAYNIASCAAWAAILVKDAWDRLPNHLYHTHQYHHFPHKLLTEVQVANAVAELTHAVIGLVPSPLGSLLLQFFARLVITVGISYCVPDLPGNYSAAYSVLVVAWATTEMVRYAFYAAKQGKAVPPWLLWLRYLTFLVMYPMGLMSEPVVVYQTLGHVSPPYRLFLTLGLFLYVPGFYFLYSYMLLQRRRYLVARNGGATRS